MNNNAPQNTGRFAFAFLALILSLAPAPASSSRAEPLSDNALGDIRFEQKLNAQVSPTLIFRDEEGKEIHLANYFGRKPLVLVLGYYECPMLCTLVLNGLLESASDMKWSIGQDFEIVNVSINPKETPLLAAAKKRAYVKRYGRLNTAHGWHFLTGSQMAIQELATEVGFRYAYDPPSRQYAHPSGVIILTPEGKVSRYLFGVAYQPKDLYAALEQASSRNVSSPVQQFVLLCFHYNPITGKYSGIIIVVLRVLAAATPLGLLWMIVALIRRGRAIQADPASTQASPTDETLTALSAKEAGQAQ
jgi:protein SCO1/2